jgi:Cu+-exporting ATPase
MRSIRGVDEPLVIYRVGSDVTAQRDPVCGMIVRDGGAARINHEGRVVYFCSQECLKRFLESPDRFLQAVGEGG